MPDLPTDPHSDGNRDIDDDTTPGWVIVSGIIAALFVIVFVILHLTGRGMGDH